MRWNFFLIVLSFCLPIACAGQVGKTEGVVRPWSQVIAESFLRRHADGMTYDSASPNRRWNYEQGFILRALLEVGKRSGDGRYFAFVKRNLDRYIGPDGAIDTYKKEDFNLDNILPGRALLAVYDSTHEERYRLALQHLRDQLSGQPRTNEGGFWHKKIYPYQIWLDGLYMAGPFYAGYGRQFNEGNDLDDVAGQFKRIYRNVRDEKTGLLFHAWDERREQQWADKKSGCSPQFWSRAIGWYLMGLVDLLDLLPADHPDRASLIAIASDVSSAVMRFRDEQSKLWFQVTDQGSHKGNYLETSASAMFCYAFARGAREGYLPERFRTAARESFEGLIANAIVTRSNGGVDVVGTCRSAGLGGDPYRDGSFNYYVSEPKRTNDLKGIAAVLLAATEIEQAAPVNAPHGRDKQ